MSKTASCIILTQKAEVKQGKISLQDGLLTLDSVKQYLKKKEIPEVLGTYRYKTNTLTLIGYTDGKAGTENKHELPPPFDNTLCFGDVVLIASLYPTTYTKPVAFKPEDYEAFYTKMFGGFDDIDSEDDEDADEAEEAEEVEEVSGVKEKIIVEEVDDEEEDEVDDEEEAEAEGEAEAETEAGPDVEIEEDLPIRPAKVSKKKRAAAALQSGTSQILHIPKEDHLQKETSSNAHLFPKREIAIEQIESILTRNNITGIDVQELEHCIYNASITEATNRHVTCHWNNSLFKHVYLTKVRHILGNLIPTAYVQNTKLLDELRSGKYSIEDICSLNTYTICNERWRDFIHRRQQREKRQLEGNKAMATDQFLCMRCHKRECTYYEMQTRSADEPMTIFIQCMNCGKHWRQ